jgi:hypothetical protein
MKLKAVRWAVTKEVDIISMSWTIESNSDDVEDFRKAIKAASDKGIIMFCAFSDQGNVHKDNCFPSAFDSTLTIGAATALGSPCTWVNTENVAFLLPGEHITIDRNAEESVKPESGSSIATALAAGLASLLLYIAQLVDAQLYPELRKPEKMKKAFERLGVKDKYVQVYEKFPLSFEEWNWDSGEGLNKLTALVTSLVVK